MFNVLSFDSNRITVTLSGNRTLVVRKKTTTAEHTNIMLASHHLLKHQPSLISEGHGRVRILVAEIVEWDYDKKFLYTSFCNGKNLEELMRETIGLKRKGLIDLIRGLFNIFKESGFLWGDFAPRNMIWDRQRGIIWLVDFEREISLKDCPIEKNLFNRYVRNYSFEEFSSFITKEEKTLLFKGFLNEKTGNIIRSDQITSKRKLSLLDRIYGKIDYYMLDQVRKVEDIMSSIATPFQIHGVFFFPMDSLDLIGSRGGPNEYTEAVMAILNLGKKQRFCELKKRAASF